MSTFVDTSALYAVIDASDTAHEAAAAAFRELAGQDLVTHNYILVEAVALVQRRLGMSAVRDLTEGLLLPSRVVWVDREMHELALSALLASSGRAVSLVDHLSFLVMRREGISTAFAIDTDFNDEGFDTVPTRG